MRAAPSNLFYCHSHKNSEVGIVSVVQNKIKQGCKGKSGKTL